jgi:hypothetical protein
VFRRQDGAEGGSNDATFAICFEVLAAGGAVALFPEGISYHAPALQPLKTGAARIALGAAKRIGGAFPIIPVGLVFRDRNSFRSEVRVVVGDTFEWGDLADRADEKFAVRELTARIDGAMRRVTLNLDSWEDAALVHVAEQIWAAEHGSPRDSEATVSRLAMTANVLQRFRSRGDAEWQMTARELRAHARMLQRMGLSPQALKEDVRWPAALRWLLLRLPLLAAIPLASMAMLAYWPALVGARWMAAASKEGPDSVSTVRVLSVSFLCILWTVLVAGVAGWLFGWAWGVGAFVLLPSAGIGAAIVAERRRLRWLAVRRFFVRHLHRRRLARMRERQAMIAAHLNELLDLGMQ